MDEDDADEASVLLLRQRIQDEWAEGEKKDTLLATIDRLLLEKRDRQQEGSHVRSDA
jgi:hypothetical protein